MRHLEANYSMLMENDWLDFGLAMPALTIPESMYHPTVSASLDLLL